MYRSLDLHVAYDCEYMYFRFDRHHLELLSDIRVCYHWPPWVHPTKNLTYNVILFSHIKYIRVVYYDIVYFRWISPKLLIWRHTYRGHVKSMLSCREFICAQSHEQFLSYLFRQKSYTAKSALGDISSPICNTRVKQIRNRLALLLCLCLRLWHHIRQID